MIGRFTSLAADPGTSMAETMFTEIREEPGPDKGYRPMSGLAVVALIGGFLSAAALLGTVMWVVPGLAILASLASLRQSAATSRQGAGFARAGLALAVMFLMMSITFGWWQDYVVGAQARRVADLWLEATLSGDMLLSHQLTLSPIAF